MAKNKTLKYLEEVQMLTTQQIQKEKVMLQAQANHYFQVLLTKYGTPDQVAHHIQTLEMILNKKLNDDELCKYFFDK